VKTAKDCVTLTLHEKCQSVIEAATRMIASHGLNHASTYRRSFTERLHQELVGVLAERAWAKFRNEYYRSPLNEFHDVPDASDDTEVRGVDEPGKRLIVRDNDASDRRYVSLLVDREGNATVRGWMLGGDAKRDEWKTNPNGHREAWFVPNDQLRPIDELPLF
jgi:hypothetical protein